jgi:membrane protease YdiL (CAAX protease family)
LIPIETDNNFQLQSVNKTVLTVPSVHLSEGIILLLRISLHTLIKLSFVFFITGICALFIPLNYFLAILPSFFGGLVIFVFLLLIIYHCFYKTIITTYKSFLNKKDRIGRHLTFSFGNKLLFFIELIIYGIIFSIIMFSVSETIFANDIFQKILFACFILLVIPIFLSFLISFSILKKLYRSNKITYPFSSGEVLSSSYQTIIVFFPLALFPLFVERDLGHTISMVYMFTIMFASILYIIWRDSSLLLSLLRNLVVEEPEMTQIQGTEEFLADSNPAPILEKNVNPEFQEHTIVYPYNNSKNIPIFDNYEKYGSIINTNKDQLSTFVLVLNLGGYLASYLLIVILFHFLSFEADVLGGVVFVVLGWITRHHYTKNDQDHDPIIFFNFLIVSFLIGSLVLLLHLLSFSVLSSDIVHPTLYYSFIIGTLLGYTFTEPISVILNKGRILSDQFLVKMCSSRTYASSLKETLNDVMLSTKETAYKLFILNCSTYFIFIGSAFPKKESGTIEVVIPYLDFFSTTESNFFQLYELEVFSGKAYLIFRFMISIILAIIIFYLVFTKRNQKSISLIKDSSRHQVKVDQESFSTSELFAILNLFMIMLFLSLMYSILADIVGIPILPIEEEIADGSPWEFLLSLSWAGFGEEFSFRILLLGIPVGLYRIIQKLSKKRLKSSDKNSEKMEMSFSKILLGSFFGRLSIKNKFDYLMIIISSFLFGYAHYYYGWEWGKIFGSMLFGLFAGYVFLEYGLGTSILMHFMNNVFTSMGYYGDYLNILVYVGLAGITVVIFVFGSFESLRYLEYKDIVEKEGGS